MTTLFDYLPALVALMLIVGVIAFGWWYIRETDRHPDTERIDMDRNERNLPFTYIAFIGMAVIAILVGLFGCAQTPEKPSRLAHPTPEIVCAAYLLGLDVPHDAVLNIWYAPDHVVSAMFKELDPQGEAVTNAFGLKAGNKNQWDAFVADDRKYEPWEYPELHAAAHVVLFEKRRAVGTNRPKAEALADWVERNSSRCGSQFKSLANPEAEK